MAARKAGKDIVAFMIDAVEQLFCWRNLWVENNFVID